MNSSDALKKLLHLSFSSTVFEIEVKINSGDETSDEAGSIESSFAIRSFNFWSFINFRDLVEKIELIYAV